MFLIDFACHTQEHYQSFFNIDIQGYGVSIPKGNRVDNANGNNVVDCVDELELLCNWEAESSV